MSQSCFAPGRAIGSSPNLDVEIIRWVMEWDIRRGGSLAQPFDTFGQVVIVIAIR
jgi:hypothetical protein